MQYFVLMKIIQLIYQLMQNYMIKNDDDILTIQFSEMIKKIKNLPFAIKSSLVRKNTSKKLLELFRINTILDIYVQKL